MSDPVRYSDSITVRCSPAVGALVDQAAIKRGMKPSEYVRQAVLMGLRLDGLDPATIAPRDAGALYNVTADGQQWALVIEGQIKSFYRPRNSADAKRPPDEQGGVWLPVEWEDSQPFDPLQHWRLPAVARVEAGRVVRTFQVVAQEAV